MACGMLKCGGLAGGLFFFFLSLLLAFNISRVFFIFFYKTRVNLAWS